MAGAKSVLARLDRVVDDFSRRTRYFHEDLTPGRARAFAMQHRLNTRQRNSVLKLKVATKCPASNSSAQVLANGVGRERPADGEQPL